MRLKGHVFPLIISIIFFIVGVLLLFLSVRWLVEESHYEKAVATVRSAEVSRTEDGKLVVVSTYEYYVNGEGYFNKTAPTSANSAKLEGETFTVKYNPDNPEDMHTGNSVQFGVLAFGLIFTCVGGGLVIALLTGKLN